MLLPSIVSALIMILAFQLRRMESDKYCRSTIFIVLPSRFGSYLTTLSQGFLPQTDLSALQAAGLDFGVLPIMLMFAAIGILSIICFFGWVCIVLFGTLAHKAVVKYFTTKTIADEIVADIAVSGLNKFPSILGAILIAVGFATCGSVSLCLGCLCYFVKLFKMYEDYLKFLFKRAVGLKQEDDDPGLLTGINFQFTLGLLWMMSTLLNVPTLGVDPEPTSQLHPPPRPLSHPRRHPRRSPLRPLAERRQTQRQQEVLLLHGHRSPRYRHHHRHVCLHHSVQSHFRHHRCFCPHNAPPTVRA